MVYPELRNNAHSLEASGITSCSWLGGGGKGHTRGESGSTDEQRQLWGCLPARPCSSDGEVLIKNNLKFTYFKTLSFIDESMKS